MTEEEEDPEGWREAYNSDGDLYYWHLRTRRTTWSLPPSSSSLGKRRKRKRKLRRKRRTRCVPSCCRLAPDALQWEFIKVVDVPGMQVVQVLPVVGLLCATTGALVTFRGCSTSMTSSISLSWRHGPGEPLRFPSCSCTRWSKSLLFGRADFLVQVWRRQTFPVVAQSLIPMAFCSADHRDSPVAVHKVVEVPVALVVRVPQLPFVRRQSCSHSCISWRKSSRLDVVLFPVVTQRPIPVVQPLWRTIEIPQSLFDKVDDVPGMQVVLDSWCLREGDSRDLTVATVEKFVVSRRAWTRLLTCPLACRHGAAHGGDELMG